MVVIRIAFLVALGIAIVCPALADVAQVGVVAQGTNASNASATVPTAARAGDLMLAQVAVRGVNCSSMPSPKGWGAPIRCNASGSQLATAIYLKFATTTDPGSFQQWELGSSRRAVTILSVWRGVDPVVPVEADNGQANAASGNVTAPGVTTTSANAVLVGMYANAVSRTNQFSPPLGMDELSEASSGGTGVSAMMASVLQSAAGASDSKVARAVTSAVSTGQLVALHPAQPIADYRFDECSLAVGATAVDSSPNALNGTVVGAMTTLASGPVCRGANFSGTGGYVRVQDNALLDLKNQISVAAWVRHRTSSYRGWESILAKGDNTYRLHLNGGCSINSPNPSSGITMGFNGGCSDSDTNSGQVPAAGVWYHVAATFDGNTVRVYINGAERASSVPASKHLTTNDLALNIGENSQQTGRFWDGDLDEVTIWGYAISSAEVSSHRNRARTCPVCAGTLPGLFNAFESTTPAGAVTGNIKTKIAGQTFGLDLVAVKSDGSAPEAGFSGAVKVELLDASDNSGALASSSKCRSSWTLLQTLPNQTFASGGTGRLTASGITQNEAWQDVRVRISFPATGTATVVACSSDNFAIRPGSFTAPVVTDNDWQTPGFARTLNNVESTGGVVHRAGRPFSVVSRAVNAATSHSVTTNYDGTPTPSVTTCASSGCGASLGTLSFGGAASEGVLSDSNATYSEAGAFFLRLVDQTFSAADASDSSEAERFIVSPTVSVGRFVPDRFEITMASDPELATFNDASCPNRSFTYFGQPFGYLTLPQATVTARNAGGDVTRNYRGDLWKLGASSVSQTYSPLAPASPGLSVAGIGAATVTSNGDGTGSYASNGGDLLIFVRNPSVPQSQFTANISLTVNAADATEAGVTGNGTITAAAPLVFNGGGSGIAFDSGALFRYGRLRLANAYGSERLALPVGLETQYWNGYAFVTNAADFCTRIAASNINLSGYQPAGFSAAVPQANVSISGAVAAGKANLALLKPLTPSRGSLNLCVDLDSGAGGDATCQAATPAGLPYLQDRRTGATYTQDPTSRAAFGLYKGPNNFIYYRENY